MRKGFTLIEVLAVVMIVGILSAVALPYYRKAIEHSRAAEPVTVWDHFKKMAIAELSVGSLPMNDDVCASWLRSAGLGSNVGTTYQNEHFVYSITDCSKALATLSITRQNGEDTLYTLTGSVSKNGFMTRASDLTCTAGTLTDACAWFDN